MCLNVYGIGNSFLFIKENIVMNGILFHHQFSVEVSFSITQK